MAIAGNLLRFGVFGQALAVACLGLSGSLSEARAQESAVPSGGRIVVEGLVLWRDEPNGKPFTGSSSGGPAVVSASPGDFDPDAGAGIRVLADIPSSAIGGLLPPGWALQLGGMFASGIEGNIAGSDPNEDTDTTYSSDLGGIVSPSLSDADAEEIGGIELDLKTTLAGSESNYLTPDGSVLGGRAYFGTRFIHFRENLNATVFDDFPPGSGTDNHNIGIDVTNNLFGVQLGWEGYVPLSSGISIGGRFAGGLLANFVERDRSLFDVDSADNRYSDSLSETEFSQMLEANPKLLFDLGNGASLTVGGMVLWLNEVSQSSSHWSNMLNLDDRNIRANDDVLFYGASAGLSFRLN